MADEYTNIHRKELANRLARYRRSIRLLVEEAESVAADIETSMYHNQRHLEALQAAHKVIADAYGEIVSKCCF